MPRCALPSLLLALTAAALPAAEPIMVLPRSDGHVEFVRNSAEATAKLGMLYQAITEIKTIAITWRIEYLDQAHHNGRGFDSPGAGADRRKALEETFSSIGNILGGSGSRTVEVRVEVSLDSPLPTLANAYSPFSPGPAGIQKNHLQKVIQNNVDPSPGYAEVVVQFNFHNSKLWHTGTGAPALGYHDLRSVALHELTHALGFSSWADPQGNSIATGTNPGLFSVFDSFIGRRNGTRLFTSGGQFTGTAADFTGATGGLSWYGPQTVAVMGNGATLYTPSTYDAGSSVSHWATTPGDPVMFSSIAAGVRRRNYTDYEITLLRDLGYTDAALPKPPFRFDVPVRFPVSGTSADAVAVQNIDHQGGLDLIVLNRQGPDSVLEIFSGLNPNQVRTLKLPSESYFRMSPASVGPVSAAGVVLGSYSQGTLLSLGGLQQPGSPRPLTLQDFSHVHRVVAPTPSPSAAYFADSAVPAGDLNGDGAQDYVGYSRTLGFMPFLNDTHGYFDRLLGDRDVLKLAAFGSVVRDVAPYEMGAMPPAIGLDIPSGLLPEIIVNVKDPPGSSQSRQLDSGPAVMVQNLSRVGVVGFGRIQDSAKEELVAVSFLPAAPAPYQIRQRWSLGAGIRHVLTLPSTPTKAVVVTDGHTLELVDSATAVVQRLAGSSQGYADGPALAARFDGPVAVCEANGILYVVDAGNCLIRTVNLSTAQVGTLAGRRGVSSMVDGPAGTGTFAFNSGMGGASNCAIIGDSLYVMNAASAGGPFALRKINLNTRHITTVPSNQLGVYSFPRHLRTHRQKLYYIDGVNPATVLRGMELFPQNPTVDSGSLLLRLADLDNDGRDEVVNLLNTAPAITISKTRADGNFSHVSTFQVGPSPLLCEVRDIDRDGTRDIVVAYSSSVQVFLGNGSGGFVLDATRTLSLGGFSNVWTTVQDVNADGRIDITNVDAGGALRIYLADNTGRWGNGPGNAGENFWSSLSLGGWQPKWFALSDLNGDGYVDLLMRPIGGNAVFILYGQVP